MPQALEAEQDKVRHDNVARILVAAERLFRHYGYAKTTVADIAKDLGMSPANIYRFFASKVEIHQALCARCAEREPRTGTRVCGSSASAEERLRRYSMNHYQYTVETMLDAEKVHEMVIVAIERDWQVVDQHIDQLQSIVRDIIAEGMANGEFTKGDPELASRCFGAATSALHHPQLVAQCIGKGNRASAEELTEFSIRALKA